MHWKLEPLSLEEKEKAGAGRESWCRTGPELIDVSGAVVSGGGAHAPARSSCEVAGEAVGVARAVSGFAPRSEWEPTARP